MTEVKGKRFDPEVRFHARIGRKSPLVDDDVVGFGSVDWPGRDFGDGVGGPRSLIDHLYLGYADLVGDVANAREGRATVEVDDNLQAIIGHVVDSSSCCVTGRSCLNELHICLSLRKSASSRNAQCPEFRSIRGVFFCFVAGQGPFAADVNSEK